MNRTSYLALFCLLAALLIIGSVWVFRSMRQGEIVAALQERGFRVYYGDEINGNFSELERGFSLRRIPVLGDRLPPDWVVSAAAIDAQGVVDISADDLRLMVECPNLRAVNLGGKDEVDDQMISELADASHLETINLSNTSVSPIGLQKLQVSLPNTKLSSWPLRLGISVNALSQIRTVQEAERREILSVLRKQYRDEVFRRLVEETDRNQSDFGGGLTRLKERASLPSLEKDRREP